MAKKSTTKKTSKGTKSKKSTKSKAKTTKKVVEEAPAPVAKPTIDPKVFRNRRG